MPNPKLTKRNEVFNQQIHSDVVFSKYDLSCGKPGSYSMGILYPIYCRDDIHPGDKFQIGSAPFLRCLPWISPALADIDIDIRYFFIPRRILWSQWKQFISPNTSADAQLTEPYIQNREETSKYGSFYNVRGSIYDYMGCSCIPWTNAVFNFGNGSITAFHAVGQSTTNQWDTERDFGEYSPSLCFDMSTAFPGSLFPQTDPLQFSAYPFLAYNAIFNEYYRDENLQTEELAHVTTGGNHHGYQFRLKRINWEKDYFSSALPWVTQAAFSTPAISNGMTIEELRETSALTKWLELQAIGGHRYQESILTHFGIRVPDEAAQIPVYLGGGRVPISVGSVEQNSETQTTPLATLAGRATGSGNMFVDKFEFREHGTILGVMCIRPKAVYADVTPRDLFVRESRHDYLWPSFVNLGDEAVKSDELNPGFFSYGRREDFGYQYRYCSYRTAFDQVSAQLAPGESLESWTIARSWMDQNNGTPGTIVNPAHINHAFIKCKPSTRIFAVQNPSAERPWWPSDNIVGTVNTYVEAVRPLPSYIDPKID